MIRVEKKDKIFFSLDKKARELSLKSFFGEIRENKVLYMPSEVLWLIENKKAKVYKNNKNIKIKDLIKELSEKDILEHLIYKDLRKKGYILKTGTKYGGNFIVYDKGKKPGINHSDWILIIVRRKSRIDVESLAGKIRTATSTNKKILLALIDENKNIYYEIKWKKM